MIKRADRSIRGEALSLIGALFGAWQWLVALVAFLVVVPFMLWFTVRKSPNAADAVTTTLFCLSFAWFNVSILRWQRFQRKMGFSGEMCFGSGPRPKDPDELEMWNRGRQFCYSIFAVIFSMGAVAFALWMNRE